MLRALARSYGVQTRYLDADGKSVDTRSEVVVSVLRTLGAPIENDDGLADVVRARRYELVRRVLPPVAVVWDGGVDGVRMTLPAELGSRSLEAMLHLENGDVREWAPSGRVVLRSREVEGQTFMTTRLPLPSLPHGYHRLSVSVGGAHHETLIVRAPARSFRDSQASRRWGLFAPLYALHSRRSDGIGRFSELAQLMELTRDHGGAFVGTLPFFASFPEEPSPYSPISRLFWNELYLDAGAGPANEPRSLLDYPSLHAARRTSIERMENDPDALATFQQRVPLVLDYARFRAAAERYGSQWREWPEPYGSGVLDRGDVDDEEVAHHVFSQYACDQQLDELAKKRTALYLDLPLGVHRHGYDTWREQTLFAHDVSVGAPPDRAFPGGQNWSTPPVLPAKSRQQEHRHLRSVFRNAMRYADVLRIDHVMGLHRQFWVPDGADVSDGVYVHYPAEELYAIACLESHRSRCELVGENLGIVPAVVNETMARRGVRGIYVLQLTPNDPIPRDVVASLNTHDTETFAAYSGDDAEALGHALSRLMKSEADLVSVAIEDLWLERDAHNVPGTTIERPNWRRPMRYSLDELEPLIGTTLDTFRR